MTKSAAALIKGGQDIQASALVGRMFGGALVKQTDRLYPLAANEEIIMQGMENYLANLRRYRNI